MSWVIRRGTTRGIGTYWGAPYGSERADWQQTRTLARRFDSYQNACMALGNLSDVYEARLVRVRPRWRPRCGDRVRILVADQKDRLAFVTNTERPERIFVSVPSLNCVTVGPYASKDLALEVAAKPGPRQPSSTPSRDE